MTVVVAVATPAAHLGERLVNHRTITLGMFVWLVLSLIGIGIARSAIATRLDGFTIDEAYHIAAGVSYVKYSDFRINPEHSIPLS